MQDPHWENPEVEVPSLEDEDRQELDLFSASYQHEKARKVIPITKDQLETSELLSIA